jgi:hypothetical protein
MSGTWADGTSFSKGGNGYDPTSNEVTTFLFPSAPDDPSGWSMVSENFLGTDQRMLLSSGPFDIEPGEVNSISFAVLFVENVPHPAPSIDSLLAAAEDAQDLYEQKAVVTSTQHIFTPDPDISFYPNPMSDMAILSLSSSRETIKHLTIYSADGKILKINNVNDQVIRIERQNHPPGLYYYQVFTSKENSYTGKFIIQ